MHRRIVISASIILVIGLAFVITGCGKAISTTDFVINNGATYSTSTEVTLSINFPSNISEMAISNDGINYSTPESVAATKMWLLTNGDGTKEVFVKYYDSNGNIISVVSSSIILDTTPPNNISIISLTTTNEGSYGANILTWQNPTDEDYERIIIVIRMDYRFATNEADVYDNTGKIRGITYEVNCMPGSTQSLKIPVFIPPHVVLVQLDQFYEIYSFDKAGNVSSGTSESWIVPVSF